IDRVAVEDRGARACETNAVEPAFDLDAALGARRPLDAGHGEIAPFDRRVDLERLAERDRAARVRGERRGQRVSEAKERPLALEDERPRSSRALDLAAPRERGLEREPRRGLEDGAAAKLEAVHAAVEILEREPRSGE